jgi:hypothetical protein
MVRQRRNIDSPCRLPLSSSGDFRLAFIRQGGGPAAGEGDRINVASEFDYQGTFGQGGENSLGLGQATGMDFDCMFEHDQTFTGYAPAYIAQTQTYGRQLESWDEGMSILLAKLESDIESSSTGQVGMEANGQEWFNMETGAWEVAV